MATNSSSVVQSYGFPSTSPTSSHVCSYPGEFSDPCEYVLDNCKDLKSILFNPLSFYYCNLRSISYFNQSDDERTKKKEISIFIYIILMLSLSCVLFLIMYFSANDHLAPALCLISKWLRLSPTVAGVTLLALGNGAPDLFTCLAGTDDIESVPLVIGGAVGSGIFVLLFVFGLVVLTVTKKQPSESLPPEAHDASKSSVDISPNLPQVQDTTNTCSTSQRGMSLSPLTSHELLSAHGLRIKGLAFRSFERLDSGLVTISAPSTHEERRSNIEALPSQGSLIQSALQKKEITAISKFSFSKHIIMYLYSVIELMVISEQQYISYFFPIFGISLYLCNLGAVIFFEILRQRHHSKNTSETNVDRIDIESRSEESISQSSRCNINNLLIIDTIKDCCTNWLYQWKNERSIPKKLLLLILTPINLIVTISIPPLYIDEDDALNIYDEFSTHVQKTEENESTVQKQKQFSYDRLRLVFNPFFSLGLLFHFLDLWIIDIGNSNFQCWILYLILSFVSSFILALTTKNDRKPIYRPVIVLLSFFICILWIYGVSDQIVTILQSCGLIIPSLSSTFMGMTVLTWGNSFGDLVVDIAIARTAWEAFRIGNNGGSNSQNIDFGGFETAITGILCGPIQNILLSMNISFLKVLISDSVPIDQKSSKISTDPVLRFGFIYLLSSIVLIVILVCFVWKFRYIPRYFGYYCVYSYLILFLPIVTLGGLGVIPGWNSHGS